MSNLWIEQRTKNILKLGVHHREVIWDIEDIYDRQVHPLKAHRNPELVGALHDVNYSGCEASSSTSPTSESHLRACLVEAVLLTIQNSRC